MQVIETRARLIQPDGNRKTFSAWIEKRSERESFVSGGKKSIKIIGALVACVLPGAILEPFLFLAWGPPVLLVIIFLVGPILHGRYWSETITLVRIEAECPNCGFGGKLGPYLSAKLLPTMTLLCRACGQTCTAEFDGV